MNRALSRAIEKAMETDVEYRRGLPVNLSSFVGTGIVSINNYLHLFPSILFKCTLYKVCNYDINYMKHCQRYANTSRQHYLRFIIGGKLIY